MNSGFLLVLEGGVVGPADVTRAVGDIADVIRLVVCHRQEAPGVMVDACSGVVAATYDPASVGP